MALFVGAVFENYIELENAIKEYEHANCVHYYKRSSRSLEASKLRKTMGEVPSNLKFVEINYYCIHGGKKFKSVSTGKRPRQSTFQMNCPSLIKVRLNADATALVIRGFSEKHNHPISQDLYGESENQSFDHDGHTKLTPQAVKMYTKKVSQDWSYEMTSVLIREVRAHWPRLKSDPSSSFSMKQLFKEVTLRLAADNFKTRQVHVELKWYNLVATYRRIIEVQNTTGDSEISFKFDFLEELDEFFKENPQALAKNINESAGPSSLGPSMDGGDYSPDSSMSSGEFSPEPINESLILNGENPSAQLGPIPLRLKREVSDDNNGYEGMEARREWREWKRHQEVIDLQQQSNQTLQSINNNLASMKYTLESILEHLINK